MIKDSREAGFGLAAKEKNSRATWEKFNAEFNRDTTNLSQAEEAMQRKMVDQILMLAKRSDESDYGASNYT